MACRAAPPRSPGPGPPGGCPPSPGPACHGAATTPGGGLLPHLQAAGHLRGARGWGTGPDGALLPGPCTPSPRAPGWGSRGAPLGARLRTWGPAGPARPTRRSLRRPAPPSAAGPGRGGGHRYHPRRRAAGRAAPGPLIAPQALRRSALLAPRMGGCKAGPGWLPSSLLFWNGPRSRNAPGSLANRGSAARLGHHVIMGKPFLPGSLPVKLGGLRRVTPEPRASLKS